MSIQHRFFIPRFLNYDSNRSLEIVFTKISKSIQEYTLKQDQVSLDSAKDLFNLNLIERGLRIVSLKEGIIKNINFQDLFKLARDKSCLIKFNKCVGETLFRGEVLAEIETEYYIDQELSERVRQSAELTRFNSKPFDFRSLFLSATKLIVQQFDRFSKEVSISDHSEAYKSLNRLNALLVELFKLPNFSPYYFDSEGNLRLIIKTIDLGEILQGVIYELRGVASSTPFYYPALFDIVKNLLKVSTRIKEREVLMKQAILIERLSESTSVKSYEQYLIRKSFQEIMSEIFPNRVIEIEGGIEREKRVG